MQFAQLYTPGLAQYSYVIGSGKQCVIVDPTRDIEACVAQAKAFGMTIVGILETHLHADFISGHMELAAQTGAPIYAPALANCSFPHIALNHGDTFHIGQLEFQLWETPGHTPESAIYVVHDHERGPDPVLSFTGDTLLIGDVGRPDLFPERETELAGRLFESLQLIKQLPDHVEVYPAHGMGSLCGRALSSKRWSTIGMERLHNQSFKLSDQQAFIADILADIPAAPDHFSRCSTINQGGPELIANLPHLQPHRPQQVAGFLDQGGLVLDVRSAHNFASGHIPQSTSISQYGNLPTFAGWVIPPDRDVVLILEREDDLRRIVAILRNVGLDRIVGYLEGEFDNWINAGMPVSTLRTISIHDLKEQVGNSRSRILDTRAESEWKREHIKGTTLAPAPDLRYLGEDWNREEPIVVLCNTSNRSMLAASILKGRGFQRVISTLGGITAWKSAPYPLIEETEAVH